MHHHVQKQLLLLELEIHGLLALVLVAEDLRLEAFQNLLDLHQRRVGGVELRVHANPAAFDDLLL